MLKLRTDVAYTAANGKLTQAGVEAIQGQIDAKASAGDLAALDGRVTVVETELAGSLINRQTAQVAVGTETEFDFTGIPAWVNRVTVTMAGVSTSGTSPYVLRVGDGAIVSTGYTGAFTIIAGGTPSSNNATSGIGILQNPTAASVYHGICVLVRHSGNTWVATSTGGLSNTASTALSGGSITLTNALDRVRLTTSGGTDTFDAGSSVNIAWE